MRTCSGPPYSGSLNQVLEELVQDLKEGSVIFSETFPGSVQGIQGDSKISSLVMLSGIVPGAPVLNRTFNLCVEKSTSMGTS